MAKASPSKTDDKDRWGTWDKRIRDLVIFLIAAGALVNELFLKDKPEIPTLVFLAGILGLPLALKADELRRGGS